MGLARTVSKGGNVALVKFWAPAALLLAVPLISARSGWAQHDDGLRFAHPLIAESPTPDTQLRFDYLRRGIAGDREGWVESSIRMEVEYFFHRNLAVGVRLPYTVIGVDGVSGGSTAAGGAITFEFTAVAYEGSRLLLGYGIEAGVPIGRAGVFTAGEDGAEVEPYLTLGYRWHGLEIIGFATLPVPIGAAEAPGLEPGFNLSSLYDVTNGIAPLLEFGREVEDGRAATYVTPGVKLGPLTELGLEVGLGVSWPLTANEEARMRGIVSLFCHF